jgi:hypothetical protein
MKAYRLHRIFLTSAYRLFLLSAISGGNRLVQAGNDSGLINSDPTPPPYYVYLPCLLKNIGMPIFFDDFSNPSSGWTVGEQYPVSRSYVDGEYMVQIDEYGWFALSYQGVKATDFRAAVTFHKATELPYNYYGFLFGVNANMTQFYSLEITSYGNYGVYRYCYEGSALKWDDITPGGGWSEYINEGISSNRLVVERNKSTIKVYAYGRLLDITIDATYTGSRYTGLIAFPCFIRRVQIGYIDAETACNARSELYDGIGIYLT